MTLRPFTALDFDNSYRRLPPAFYQVVDPTPLPAPYLVSFNPDAAALVDLDPRAADDPLFPEYVAGGRPLPGAEPIAAIYAGHQFGVWVPQLGDGRAILLGEARNARGGRWDLQLKGAGPTAFSRMGDGRAVLRSSIREYLCSEAMHGLGVPTTRALCVVGSDAPVYRETVETAAVVVRMAPTHVRFGTFQLFASRRQDEHVRTLADYVIDGHFPHLAGEPDRHARWLAEVVERTARLMAHWMAVGFAHGVMNTDNMSILGVTIDYGPFGFLDQFDAGFICNHSDPYGRYAFDQQPNVGLWNCARLAESLLSLVDREQAIAALDGYSAAYTARYAELMRAKLGLEAQEPEDETLVADLLALLQAEGADYTRTLRALGGFRADPDASAEPYAFTGTRAVVRELFDDRAAFDAWAARYADRLRREGSVDAGRQPRMDRANPKYVLRNYLAQRAIALAERREYSEIERLLTILRDPFAEHPAYERYAAEPPAEEREIVVSCSS
jgi:uncharacterized protein YdiU (UPF0061 family)